MNNQIICLGVRGSMPVSGPDTARYGGATTCIAVRLAGILTVIDAGTGLYGLPAHLQRDDRLVSLLITHPHADHLIGLPVCAELAAKGVSLAVYGRTRGGRSIKEQCGTLMAPPLWPVGLDILAPDTRYSDIGERLTIGGITVETCEGSHPGGVTLYRLTADGKRVTVMTDCTVTDENRDTLAAFVSDSDVLLIDGQYTDDEWHGREHFGHNTIRAAEAFGLYCGAKQTRIIHHAPRHTDDMLDAVRLHDGCRIAAEGEVIGL